jgi:cell division protease FtsH
MGMTMILPKRDKYGMRKKECLGTLTMQMAGRVAEQMFCDDISSGAKNDIENATSLARKMVTQWGMSDRLGAVSYSEEEEHVFLGNEITRTRKHGEKIAQQIDEEIRDLLHYAYEQAEEAIKTHSREIETMVQALLSVETLTFEEVREIINGKSADEIIESRKSTENERNRQKADDTVVKKPQNEEDRASGDIPVPAGSPA